VKFWGTGESGVPLINLTARPSSESADSGGSGVRTPLGEMVDRKELDDLNSSTGVAEDGKPRRRSIGEGLG